jgi:hypothetical protein
MAHYGAIFKHGVRTIMDATARRLVRLPLEIVLAAANAIWQAPDQCGGCLLAMHAHHRGERSEQRCVGECQALDAFILGRVPGFGKILERQLPRLMMDVGRGAEHRYLRSTLPHSHASTTEPRAKVGHLTAGLIPPRNLGRDCRE